MEKVLKNRPGLPPTFWTYVLCIFICEAVGFISALVSNTANNPWFDSLNKPSFNPPPQVFAPVWTLLYLLMGIASAMVWKSPADNALKQKAQSMFITQLFFNFCWSILFFKFHSPGFALIDIAFMLITISITIYRFSHISKTAAWLMVPYLAWVCFATALNFTIWYIN